MHGHVLLQKSPLYIQLVSNQIPHLHSVKKKKDSKLFKLRQAIVEKDGWHLSLIPKLLNRFAIICFSIMSSQ